MCDVLTEKQLLEKLPVATMKLPVATCALKDLGLSPLKQQRWITFISHA
jgi:hypothetical protein